MSKMISLWADDLIL